MLKMFLGLLVAGALLIGAKPVAAAPSISLVESAPSLGDVVHFNYDDGGLKGNKKPRIQLTCSSVVDGHLIYGEARDAEGNEFTLGGGGSEWLTTGEDAHCVATLYYWDFHPVQEAIFLASMDFFAPGN